MSLFRSIGARKDATRGTAAVEVRKSFANLFTGAGVLPGSTSPLVTGTAGWAYSVGAAGFVSTRGASDGVHLYGNDGTVTIGATGVGSTVPVAPGAGLQRIDIIWVLHPSASENSDTISDPSFGVSSGTAASTATPPTIPTGALELARNLMLSTATTTLSTGNSITQTAMPTSLRLAPAVSAIGTANIGGIASEVAIANAPTVTTAGGRRFKITGSFYSLNGTVAGDVFELKLKDSTTGSLLTVHRITIPTGLYSDGKTIEVTNVPAAGSHVYQMTVTRVSGTGTGTVLGAVGEPIEIIVEQVS